MADCIVRRPMSKVVSLTDSENVRMSSPASRSKLTFNRRGGTVSAVYWVTGSALPSVIASTSVPLISSMAEALIVRYVVSIDLARFSVSLMLRRSSPEILTTME